MEEQLSRKERKKLLKKQKKEDESKLRRKSSINKRVKILIFIIILILIIAIISVFAINKSKAPGKYNNLVTCLANSNVKMYGAYWCSACNQQKTLLTKKSFDLFTKLNGYIECDPRGKNADPQACNEIGVKAYPTWRINDKNYEGIQSIKHLSELTTCPA